MKKIFIISALVIVLAAAGAAGFLYFRKDKQTVSEDWWKNEEAVFTVSAPADFDGFRLGRLEAKKEEARELYRKDINDTWTWLVIGNLYEYAHEYDRAVMAYEHVLSLRENEIMALSNLGALYEYNLKDFVKAETFYKRAVSLSQSTPALYLNLASLYMNKMNLPAEAEKTYLSGLENTGKNPDILVALINFYKRNKQTAEAAKYAEILLERFPDDETYRRDFGDLVK